MSNSYQGFNNQVLTFKRAEHLKEKALVTVNAEGKADFAETSFIGVVDSIRGELAGVQMEGYVEIPYSGSMPLPGILALKPVEQGKKVTVDETGKNFYRVINVDWNKATIGFIL